MALVTENGTGVAGAESYASVAFASAYWSARTQLALSATWAAGTTAKQEGALREASTYIDAVWGQFFRGKRRGYVQGLLWPRTDALDDTGYELPDLPTVLQQAVAELAARALSAPLQADQERVGAVKKTRDKVGALETEVEYFDSGLTRAEYGIVAGMLAPLLNGAQPEAGGQNWAWA